MVDSTDRKGVPFSRLAAGIAIAIALAGCTQYALQETPTEPSAIKEATGGPALWRLSDEDTTIYLYGLAAALPPETTWRNAAFDEAFASADLVILETLPPGLEEQAEIQSAIQSNGIYQDGRTLSSVLSPEGLELVTSVAKTLGVPIEGIDRLRPWLASIQLGLVAVNRQGLDLTNTPSTTIAAQARRDNKAVDAFEGPTDLPRKIASLAEVEQIGMLTHVARGLRDQPEQTALLNAAWLEGDVGKISNLLHGPEGVWSSEVVYRTMLVSRNENWSETIGNVMDTHEGTVFVAVGLGHLAGKDSLVSLLQARGYSVERP